MTKSADDSHHFRNNSFQVLFTEIKGLPLIKSNGKFVTVIAVCTVQE